ncbi:MAG: hypothetical protein GY754_39315 [bacterium]|nr:hypothetical protein [bacterium]
MKRMSFLFIVVLGVGILFNAIGMAATIYVDQSGGGDYKTVQEGIDAADGSAEVNDIVKVAPGVYEEEVVIDKKVSLIGSGPNFTIIDTSRYTDAPKNAITVEVSNVPVVISGFTITSGVRGIDLAKELIICTIKNCVIVNCADGIYCKSQNLNATILNNTIVSNDGTALNLSYNTNSVGNIKGNILAFNGGYGIKAHGWATWIIDYNNVYQNSEGNYYGCEAGLYDIEKKPEFVDRDTGNYALKSGDSPCIDNGIEAPSYNDPDGTRNDMGAYAGPDSVSFWPYITGGPVITELTVTPASLPEGSKITIRAKGRVR